MDLTADEIHKHLYDVPMDMVEDRDGWNQVGMALHHQFQGSDEGLKLWNEWSARSKKFDPKDSKRVWQSFKITEKSLRFAFVMRAAADARLQAEFADGDVDYAFDEEDDDIDALLGPAARPAADNDDDDSLEETIGGGSDGKAAINWMSKLDRTDEGALKPTLHNVKLLFANDSRTLGVANLNEFTGEIVQYGKPGKKVMAKASPKGCVQLDGPVWKVNDRLNGDIWSSSMDNAIRAVFEAPSRQGGYGLKVTDRDLKAAIDCVAQEHPFHPVRDYLTSLKWDGVSRVDTLFIDYLGSPDTAYTRQVARMIMVAAVARVMRPGHKFDFAVILEGLQGRRKSTFIRVLGKDWFAELDGDFHKTQVMVEVMQGSWVMEMPELTGLNKGDVPAIKAFISRTADKVRLAYDTRAKVFPRQCVFIGSTNDRRYLRDDTGGRRFWPVECTVDQIDTEGFAEVVDQYWAEAVAIHDEMRAQHGWGRDLPLYLTDAEAQAEAARLQEDRRIETAEDGQVGAVVEWLNQDLSEGNSFDEDDNLIGSAPRRRRNVTCLLQIWIECYGKDKASYGQLQAQQIGRVMKLIPEWESTGAREKIPDYDLQRVFKRKGEW